MNAFRVASMVHDVCRALAAMLAPALFLALAGCSGAPAGEAEGPPASPLLYEIASADGTVEGWMFGTIHALPDGIRWRTPAIAAAVSNADVLVVEIAELNDGAALAATFKMLGTTPGQPSLDQRIARDLAPGLAALLDRGGINPDQFAATETWAAALMLAQISTEGDPANGTDRALIREFAGRPVRELEGARAQLAIFDRLPEAEQRALLTAVVTDADGAKVQAAKLRRAWLSGDVTVLEPATRSGILADPELRNALLVRRNHDWAAAVEPMLKDSPKLLIAVGAAHLVGPDGLASLLQTRGYSVQRIP